MPGGGPDVSGSPELKQQLDLLSDRKPGSTPSSQPASGEPGTHVVERGDTLWGIARAYGIAAGELAAANSMHTTDTLVPGSRLRIPGRQSASGPVAPSVSRRHERLPSAEARFVWPVRGAVLVPYGHPMVGCPLTGIVIRAQRGRAVVAAKSGRVSFVSEGFEGWGKVVVVAHAAGWHTWYAHLDTYDVQVGEAVKQGQVIGRAGSTGRAAQAQLGFRILRRGAPVNPTAHLP